MRTKILISTFMFFLMIEFSCGSDDSCKRDCSKAVRNNNVILEAIESESDNVTCGANTDPSSMRKITRFKAYTKDSSDNKTPRGYVMITPKLDDGVGGSWISTEYDQEEHPDGSGLKGIITKSSDFCADSCGVIEIEYTLRCPGAGKEEITSNVGLEISAGSSSVKHTTTITQKAIKTE